MTVSIGSQLYHLKTTFFINRWIHNDEREIWYKVCKNTFGIKLKFVYPNDIQQYPNETKNGDGNNSVHRRKQSKGLWRINRIKEIFGNKREITELPCKMHLNVLC